jgi:antitoxin component of RelBE/YafQ-DinJ toxin-antitoxin module
MPANSVVRARIEVRTKKEAAAALNEIGLTVSHAFRLAAGARRRGKGSAI